MALSLAALAYIVYQGKLVKVRLKRLLKAVLICFLVAYAQDLAIVTIFIAAAQVQLSEEAFVKYLVRVYLGGIATKSDIANP